MTLPFRTKLLASYVALVAVVLALALFMLNRTLTQDLQRQLDERLETHARGAATWVGESGHRHLDKLVGRIANIVGADVALFDAEGRLLGDSSGTAEREGTVNAALEEIAEARAAAVGGMGRSTRARAGSADDFHYVAVHTAEGVIVRLGAPLSSIHETVTDMRNRLIYGGAVALAAAVALGLLASRITSRPLVAMTQAATRIAGGDYEASIASESPDEFGRLAAALNRMAADLKERMTMRRDYLANVSHELRTPVAAIQGCAETLLDRPLDHASAEPFIETIHRQSKRLGELVEELFMLAELEARPAHRVTHERVDLFALASLVAETVSPQAAAGEHRVVVDPSAKVDVLADPEGLERVLQNLIDNAIKYGKERGEVRVTAERGAERATVHVEDDGPGIDPVHLPRLFERFYRVDPARSRERGGSGLGLAIVKHYVELMGGTIRVDSEPGRGTRFSFDLPLVAT